MRLAAILSRLLVLAAMALLPAAAQTTVSIHQIMVASGGTYNLPDSPYLYTHYGSTVSVSGVVVGVMSTGDFAGSVYLSEPSGSWDSNVATAEGMPIFSLTAVNSACAVVGASITVTGKVVESNTVVPADITAANTPGTGILPSACTVNSTGGTMTKSISLNSTLNTFGGALEYTGMTTSATFYAVAPTSGTLTESTETVASTGQFWATLSSNTATNNHLFRAAGIAADEYKPTAAPATVATWTGNPQRILIDTTTFGGTAIDITVGQTITCTTGANIRVGATAGIGLIDYTLGYARLLIFPTSVCTVGGTVATTTAATADATHFHVGTLDLNRFYSTTGATTGSVAVSGTAYTTRLAKAASAIVNSLGTPDILSLQEVQDATTLGDIASAVNTLGSTAYTPYLTPGADPNSLNLGLLVNSTVKVTSVTQVEAANTYATTSGSSATLWERPPLVLVGEFVRTGKNYPVTVIDVHLTPRDNIGDATLGPDVRAHRAAQAADLSALVQTYQAAGANVVVAGNFNAFEYNDGYVDVLGVVKGSPAAAAAVTLYTPTSTTAALTDFTTSVPATARYNFLDRGNAESLEHILASATVTDSSTASASLASYVSAVTQPHFSADFAAANANSSTTAAGLTPHDGFVVAFLIPPVPTTASISSTAVNFGSVLLGSSATQTVTITNTTTFASTVNVSNIAISGTNPADFSQTSTCAALSEGQSCTITLTFAPTAVGTRSATLTVTNDSTSDPTLTASLTGVGVATTATLTPVIADFGTLIVGATSAAKTFTFTNPNSVALTVSSVTASGDFAIASSACTGTIAAGATCAITITFTPTATGARTGTLSVANSSSANPTVTAALTGTGTAALSVSPTALTFGSVDLTATSAAQTVTLTNATAAPIALTGITLSGDFAETSACASTLPALSSCTIAVRFTPTATGARTGTLSIATGYAATPLLTVALTGNGIDFALAIAPTTGSVIAGDTITPTVTLTPIAGYTGTIALTCTTTAGGSTCATSPTSTALTAATTLPLAITTTSQYTVIGYSGIGVGYSEWVYLVSLLSAGALLLGRKRTPALRRSMFLLMIFGILGMANLGCSGRTPDKNESPTYPGSYTYTVSATDGTLVHTATYTLTVTIK